MPAAPLKFHCVAIAMLSQGFAKYVKTPTPAHVHHPKPQNANPGALKLHLGAIAMQSQGFAKYLKTPTMAHVHHPKPQP